MGTSKKITITVYISLQIIVTLNLLFVLKITELRDASLPILMALSSILLYLLTVFTNVI